MVLYPLMNRFGDRRRSHLGEFPPAKRLPEMSVGLPANSSAVTSVIEPAQDGTWVLRMRSIQATTSGVPRQWAFYTAVGRIASLGIHTACVRDCERSVEEDEDRLRREARMFDLHTREATGLSQGRLRHAGKPAALPVISDWSEGSIRVGGTPILIRSARLGDRGWIGWWRSDGLVIKVQSDAVPASQIALITYRN